MKTLLILLGLLLSATVTQSQTYCVPVGQSAYCAGPNGGQLITPLNRSQGIITGSQGTTPYLVAPRAPRGIEPLAVIPRLPNLQEFPDDNMPLDTIHRNSMGTFPGPMDSLFIPEP